MSTRIVVTVTMDKEDDGTMTWHISSMGKAGLGSDYYTDRSLMAIDLGHELVAMIPKK